MMTFQVGQKVVCVDAVPHTRYTPFASLGGLGGLRKNEVYTIRCVGIRLGVSVVRLEEIVRAENTLLSEENFYAAARFRPIVERKTEVSFTAGADPSTDQFDNRRKVRVRV